MDLSDTLIFICPVGKPWATSSLILIILRIEGAAFWVRAGSGRWSEIHAALMRTADIEGSDRSRSRSSPETKISIFYNWKSNPTTHYYADDHSDCPGVHCISSHACQEAAH